MLEVSKRMTEVTLDVFRSMMNLDIEAGPVTQLPDDPSKTEIVSFVGLSGTSQGVVGIYSSARLAMRMTGALLGVEHEAVDDEVRDGFGEVANIIAGNVATELGNMGETVQLSLPSVIDGRCLVTSILNTTPPRRAWTFTVDGEILYVELALRRGGD